MRNSRPRSGPKAFSRTWSSALKAPAAGRNRQARRPPERDRGEDRPSRQLPEGGRAIGGCIVTIDRDGSLKVIQGLIRAEDLPTQEDGKGGRKNGRQTDPAGSCDAEDDAEIIPPSVSPRSSNPAARAREEAGVGNGLADDLRAIWNGIVKSRLAGDFGAAFDLVLFQFARAVFDSSHYPEHCTSSEKLVRFRISGDGEVGIGDRQRFCPVFPAVKAAAESRQQAVRPPFAVVAGGPGRSSPHAVA